MINVRFPSCNDSKPYDIVNENGVDDNGDNNDNILTPHPLWHTTETET